MILSDTVPGNVHRSPFRSFWMGGFESACHINRFGQRLDMVASNRHDAMAIEDYGLLASEGIHVARDGLRWHLIDKGSHFDFSSVEAQANAAALTGCQVIWNLCHYGYPDGLDLFSGAFVERFQAFSRAVARYFRDRSDDVPFYTPVNEMSFFAWAACRFIHPFAQGRDDECKRQLVRASIAACQAILDVDPRARFVQPEPLIHVVPPVGNSSPAHLAIRLTEAQFEAAEMLAGLQSAELGGQPRYLDIVGLNFYHSNQWEQDGERLRWEGQPRDPRWMPLHRMLMQVSLRLGHPLIISETSHIGVGRGDWIRDIGAEVALARELGVPLQGICLYPILDRVDWENDSHWHNSGLWDIEARDGSYRRVIDPAYQGAFAAARALIDA